MDQNILIIAASPRKGGNTDVLCDEFARGALESGNQVEKLYLSDLNIGYCTGCGTCFAGNGCSQQDDMGMVKEKLAAADVIVFASPIYFYTICGQLKTFIDRLCAFYRELSDKKFYYIFASADTATSTMDKAVSELDGLMTCLKNPTVRGIIRGTGVFRKGQIKYFPAMEEAFTMGKYL